MNTLSPRWFALPKKACVSKIACMILRQSALVALLFGVVLGFPQEKSKTPRVAESSKAEKSPEGNKKTPKQETPLTEQPSPSREAKGDASKTGENAIGIHREYVHQGISVKLAVEPLSDEANSEQRKVQEGENVTVKFHLTDTATGTSVTGSRPAVWLDLRKENRPLTDQECKQRIESLLGGSLGDRSEIDLNVYYVLALNDDATISVVDPLFGYGGSKLLAMIWLKSPGEDWTLSSDESKLFVSMPQINQVAAASTANWQVLASIDVGARPTSVALQPDGKYLWVGCDGQGAESGVTVIDAFSNKAVSRIATGAGHHEIAFTDDNLYAFVTNKEEGTLTIIDIQKLTKVRDLKTGRLPVSVAFSPISKEVYVSNEGEGTVAVVDSHGHKVLAELKAKPGLGMIRFAPGGRLGFLANTKESVVHIIDAATNQIVQTGDVGKEPDQITFTENLAYVRSRWSTDVLMIPLTQVGKPGPVPVVDFTGGQTPFGMASRTSPADAIVPAPEGAAVLVANPVDKMIYYYKEGMAAPMGSFQNPERQPRAVLVVDKSMRESQPGIYSSTVKLTQSGDYSVAFFSDSPRVLHCFDVSVAENPLLKKPQTVALKIEPLVKQQTAKVGEPFRIRFKVVDTQTQQPKGELKDVSVLTFLAPGIWQKRTFAKAVGGGIYEMTFTPPQTGFYYVFWECQSLHVRYNQIPYLVLEAKQAAEKSVNDATPGKPEEKRGILQLQGGEK